MGWSEYNKKFNFYFWLKAFFVFLIFIISPQKNPLSY